MSLPQLDFSYETAIKSRFGASAALDCV